MWRGRAGARGGDPVSVAARGVATAAGAYFDGKRIVALGKLDEATKALNKPDVATLQAAVGRAHTMLKCESTGFVAALRLALLRIHERLGTSSAYVYFLQKAVSQAIERYGICGSVSDPVCLCSSNLF